MPDFLAELNKKYQSLLQGLAKLGVVGFADPVAYSRRTRTPIYKTSDAGKDVAGGYYPSFNSIVLNTAKVADENSGPVVLHESAHALAEPYLKRLATDPQISRYLPAIRKGLNERWPQTYPAGLSNEQVATEALAFRVDPEFGFVPGLTLGAEQAVTGAALPILNKKSRSIYEQLLGLQKSGSTPP